MICTEIITKTKFEEYLKSIILNKVYLERLMALFENVRDISKHEKIMYLLYNEYISLYDVLYGCYDDESKNFNIEQIDAILAAHSEKFELPYAYTKNDFFRNHVVTLTFKNYQGIYNIKNQLAIVYKTLTEDEKNFLKEKFNISNDNFIDLVRLQTGDEIIELSKIEQDTELLNKASSIISELKIYKDNTMINTTQINETDTLLSILNKIDLGTIH